MVAHGLAAAVGALPQAQQPAQHAAFLRRDPDHGEGTLGQTGDQALGVRAIRLPASAPFLDRRGLDDQDFTGMRGKEIMDLEGIRGDLEGHPRVPVDLGRDERGPSLRGVGEPRMPYFGPVGMGHEPAHVDIVPVQVQGEESRHGTHHR